MNASAHVIATLAVIAATLAAMALGQTTPTASVAATNGLPVLPLWVATNVGNDFVAAGYLGASDLAGWGVTTTLSPDGVNLARGARTLDWTNDGGWTASQGDAGATSFQGPAPVAGAGGWSIPVSVLGALGLTPAPSSSGIIFAASSDGLSTVTATRDGHDVSSRLVLDLTAPVEWRLSQERGRLRARLFACTAQAASGQLPAPAPAGWSIKLDGPDCVLDATFNVRADARVFRLRDPARIVLEVFPVDPLPVSLPGLAVVVRTVATTGGSSSLTVFSPDPNVYAASVVSAPPGEARSVQTIALLSGATLAVNGGYFDPPSGVPVDLVVDRGQVLSYARGDRPAFGWDDVLSGVLFGMPQVRLWVTPQGTGLRPMTPISTVSANAHAGWLTAWPGDGRTLVGAAGFLTLILRGGAVASRVTGRGVAPSGALTLTFQPKLAPALDLPVGAGIALSSAWADRRSGGDWSSVASALAAGPTLVRDGVYAVNAASESFDTKGGVWRPTRQAALGLDAQGWLALAWLEHGSPEDFARALLARHWRQAMRLDSGSSVAIVEDGSLVTPPGSRPVANAIVWRLRPIPSPDASPVAIEATGGLGR